ncbi:hypothetical protein KR093_007698 [Drosophila rubida]|uniref:RING-type domain-containing protein n=1 Tax=Drosophila rubida TaxID=30044 RepID=A0AAD4K0T8_9MUSC|nr:hypothetical protein KR093_007698 [Drosophila rubida]
MPIVLNTLSISIPLYFFITATIVFLLVYFPRFIMNRCTGLLAHLGLYKDVLPNGYSCAICLDTELEGIHLHIRLGCGHIFHKNCISRWVVVEESCPICRCAIIPPGEEGKSFIVRCNMDRNHPRNIMGMGMVRAPVDSYNGNLIRVSIRRNSLPNA